MAVTTLRGNGGCLSLQGQDWCEVVLETNGYATPLGADVKSKVVERLCVVVRDGIGPSTVGQIDGIPVSWLTSLSERHCTLYAAEVNETLRIYIQDSKGATVGRIDLSAAQREEWLRALAETVTHASE